MKKEKENLKIWIEKAERSLEEAKEEEFLSWILMLNAECRNLIKNYFRYSAKRPLWRKIIRLSPFIAILALIVTTTILFRSNRELKRELTVSSANIAGELITGKDSEVSLITGPSPSLLSPKTTDQKPETAEQRQASKDQRPDAENEKPRLLSKSRKSRNIAVRAPKSPELTSPTVESHVPPEPEKNPSISTPQDRENENKGEKKLKLLIDPLRLMSLAESHFAGSR